MAGEWVPGLEPDVPPPPTSAAARILSGLTSRSVAFGFTPMTMQNRITLFQDQRISGDGPGPSYGLGTRFFERVSGIDELYEAARVAVADSGLGDRRMGLLASMTLAIFPSIYGAPEGAVPLPDPGERSIGGHIVPISGVEGGTLTFRSDWSGWGQGGTGSGTVTRAYLDRHFRGGWVSRHASGPSPFGGQRVPGEQPPAILEALAAHEGPPEASGFSQLGRTAAFDVVGRWLIGAVGGRPWVQVLAVARTAGGRRVVAGWCDACLRGERLDVEELFVWPPYRNQGMAVALAGSALLSGFAHGGRVVCWLESRDDAEVRQMTGARLPRWLHREDWGPSHRVDMATQSQPISAVEAVLDLATTPVDSSITVWSEVQDGRRLTWGGFPGRQAGVLLLAEPSGEAPAS